MPVAVLVVIAVGVVVVIRAASGRSERRLVTSYVQAWIAGDYAHMYSLLDPASRAQMSEAGSPPPTGATRARRRS